MPSPSKNTNLIASLRGKHDPHYKMATRVDLHDRELKDIHVTLAKSFGLQRKTLQRLLNLEKKVDGIPRGVTTIKGPKGDTGKTGRTGRRGRTGRGRRGRAGRAGRDGFDGFDGLDGASGSSGSSGSSGASGASGSDGYGSGGASGASGASGSSGAAGSDGYGYGYGGASGAAGAAGASGGVAVSRLIDTGYGSRVLGQDAGGGYQTAPQRKIAFRRRKISADAFRKGSSVGGAQTAMQKAAVDKAKIDLATKYEGSSADGVTPTDADAEGGGKSKGTGALLAPLQAINTSLTNINTTLVDGAKGDKKAADDARKAAEKKKRKGAEGALEKIGGVAIKGIQGVLKPAMGIFGRIWDFIKTVFLGRIVMKVFDYFAKNKDKMTTLFKFIKDWWPVMVAGILAIFGPILGPVGWVVGVGALIWWGVGAITNLVKFVGDIFGGIWKFITGGNKDADKAEADALKEVDKDLDDSEFKEGEDQGEEKPAGSDTAQLDQAQTSQDESQRLQPATESGDEPVKMASGGQVPGSGSGDTVPAMLTPGEFVMSKGAVQSYGVNTLSSMNAAAGGTNTPQEKQGRSGFSGGGLILPRVPVKHYSGGGEVKEDKKGGGIGGFLGGLAGKMLENNPIIKMILKPLIKGVKNLIVGVHNTIHGEEKAVIKGGKMTSPPASASASTPAQIAQGGAAAGASVGGIAKKAFSMTPLGMVMGAGSELIKKMKGAGAKDIKPPVSKHSHPFEINKEAAKQQGIGQGSPTSQDLPAFDAGAMVSMSKIRTLGITV